MCFLFPILKGTAFFSPVQCAPLVFSPTLRDQSFFLLLLLPKSGLALASVPRLVYHPAIPRVPTAHAFFLY